MISLYVGMALHSRKRGLTMLGIFAILYGLLYMILQLEDYALLAGAIAGFVLLTATMFATLRVNWSGEDGEPNPPLRCSWKDAPPPGWGGGMAPAEQRNAAYGVTMLPFAFRKRPKNWIATTGF